MGCNRYGSGWTKRSSHFHLPNSGTATVNAVLGLPLPARCIHSFAFTQDLLGCRPKEEMDGFPYLEIRNRDCLNNNIKILICRYHRDSNIDDIKDYQELKRRVIEVENQYDENNKIFKVIGTEKQNKTFAMYICEKVDDEKTFLNIVEKAIDRYLEIIKDFKHTIKEDYVQDSFHN